MDDPLEIFVAIGKRMVLNRVPECIRFVQPDELLRRLSETDSQLFFHQVPPAPTVRDLAYFRRGFPATRKQYENT